MQQMLEQKKKRGRKPKNIPTQTQAPVIKTPSMTNQVSIDQLVGDSEDQVQTVLTMRSKKVHKDDQDPGLMSMYMRKITMKDFQIWARSQTKVKVSSRMH